jgi:hypothetical protein
MAQIILPIYQILDKFSLIVSSYAFMQVFSFYTGITDQVSNPVLQKITLLLSATWYIGKYVTKIIHRKTNKRNKELESENIELDNEIKKELLKRVKKGNIDDLLEELEEKQRELKDNERN